MSLQPELTLWSANFLMFPSRIEFYLHEKPLPPTANLIHLHCEFSETGDFIVPGNFEPPPQGTLPSLRVRIPGQPDHLIRESTAILEYLEEAYPRGTGSLLGTGPLERARNRDFISLSGDLSMFLGVWMYNCTEIGRPRMPWGQSEAVARWARKRAHELLDRMVQWKRESSAAAAEGSGPRWISGTAEPMMADVVLLGTVAFAKAFYGVDLVRHHAELQEWRDRWEARGTVALQKSPPEWMLAMSQTAKEELL
jgi:glutathione S-transferase